MKKKNYLKEFLGVILITMVACNIYCGIMPKMSLSDLLLTNIEALADDGENNDKVWTAPRTVACDYREGPWHTASIERLCEFCVTPNTCTPRACGM